MRVRPTRLLSVGLLVVLMAAATSAARGPRAQLRGEQQLPSLYGQGVARVGRGWIVSGTDALARLGEDLAPTRTVAPAIAAEWRGRGYRHIGDVDVVGGFVYVPLEQADFDAGRQATARYDARTLEFVDAVELPQHENSFVTVDPRTSIAYTMDRFGGDRLLRYDVRHAWRVLSPLVMSRTLERVQGGDVARGAVWLSTDDAQHEMFRVDLRSGRVDPVGSSGHAGGEGEGIDATSVGSSLLHVMTVDKSRVTVWLGHFAVIEAGATPVRNANDRGGATTDWPPVLVIGAAVLGVAAIAAGGVVFRRARVGLRRGGGAR